MIPPGFQMLAGSISPSHAYVHVVEFAVDVTVHGMAVNSGDLIHADRHGAVVVPIDKIEAMRPAFVKITAQEARIIQAARDPGATVEVAQGGAERLRRHGLRGLREIWGMEMQDGGETRIDPAKHEDELVLRGGIGGGTSVSMQRRMSDSRFVRRYFVGYGIDVGGGHDCSRCTPSCFH